MYIFICICIYIYMYIYVIINTTRFTVAIATSITVTITNNQYFSVHYGLKLGFLHGSPAASCRFAKLYAEFQFESE